MASDHSTTATDHSHSHSHDDHAHPHSHDHGHGHGAHDVSKSIRKYLLIFGALMVGTIVTVLASYIDFGNSSINIAVALFIAIVKGSLVAAYFMHLIDERKMIYGVLGATFFFVTGLMYLTLWSTSPTSLIHH